MVNFDSAFCRAAAIVKLETATVRMPDGAVLLGVLSVCHGARHAVQRAVCQGICPRIWQRLKLRPFRE